MKKAILVLLVGLFWCNTSYAIGYKIKLLEKNEYGIVFKMTIPWSDDPFKWANTFRKTRETSIQHCNTYNKDTYVFWSQYYGAYARDQEGKFYDDMYGFFGIIQDLQYGLGVRARYFCAENVDEAYNYLERYDDLFKKKFKTKMHIQTILYSKINDDPFDFKNIDGTGATFVSKPKTAEEVAQKETELAELKKIGGYKKTCSALGFKIGTDKFADCMLKLFVADNKEVQVVQSSSGVQEMIIYDPDREFRINMKKWKDRRSGKCRFK